MKTDEMNLSSARVESTRTAVAYSFIFLPGRRVCSIATCGIDA
jgi:hypothetical protein